MITLRAKKLKSGLFSLYLDYNQYITQVDEKGNVRKKRKVEYLNLRVSKDYTATDSKTGKPVHKNILTQDKETWKFAQTLCRKRELMMITSDQELLPQEKLHDNFVEFFAEQLKVSDSKNNQSYKGALFHLRKFTEGSLTFRELDIHWLLNFRKYLLTKVSNNTTQTYLDRLKIIFRLAIKLKIIRESPFVDLPKLKQQKKEPVFLVLDELIKLKSHQEGISKDIVQAFFFACQTGLRFSDVSKLTWKEVESGKYICQKTQKTEILHLSHNAEEILLEQHKGVQGDLVFQLPRLDRINKKLSLWAKQAGILKKITFHVARHTCATMLISSGVDIYTVSKILGHSSVSMTEIYAQVLEDKKIEAVKKLPKF